MTRICITEDCQDCRLNDAAVEMPCATHCRPELRAERDRRFDIVIAGAPAGMKRRALQHEGKWTAW